MVENKVDMKTKLEITVEKTVEAIARIQRFVVKYGPQLSKDQVERISNKLKELQGSLQFGQQK